MIMQSIQLSFRTLLIVALVVGATGLLLGNSEAAGTSGETEYRWLITAGSISQGDKGFCDESSTGTVCREECLVYVDTGVEVPTGHFRCLPF